MMNAMAGGPMMWGMGLLWILLIVVLILAGAALVKVLVFLEPEIAERCGQ